MNKTQFVELVQQKGSYKTKVEAEAAIKAFTEAVSEALANDEEILLMGFGSFLTATQKGKSGKVPGTDKTYTTADKKIVKFKPGKNLKDRVAIA